MSSKNQEKASSVVHPTASAAAGVGVTRIALTGSAQNVAIPSAWSERFLKISVEGANGVQYGFSTSGAAVTIVLNQAATPSSGSAAAGSPIAAGGFADGRIPKAASHLCWISTASGGYLVLHVSETV